MLEQGVQGADIFPLNKLSISHAESENKVWALHHELVIFDGKMERALIIRKPWIDRILNNGKTWEKGSRTTKVRGEIGLIEAVLSGCAHCPLTEFERVITVEHHQVEDLDLLKKWGYPWFFLRM